MSIELKNQLKAEQRVARAKVVRIKEMNALKQVIYAVMLLVVSIIPIMIDGDGTLTVFAIFVWNRKTQESHSY